MKMKKCFGILLTLLIALSFAACDGNSNEVNTPGESTQPANHLESSAPADMQNNQTMSPVVSSEQLGFEGGNIGAGGLVCGGDDGYIYFRSETDWRLYKAKPDGSEKTKICDKAITDINVLDGWVYFIGYSDSTAIYKVRTDGTDETKLVEGYCDNLYVAESGMYFDIRDENNAAQAYYADLDGKGLTKMISDCYVAYYYDGKVYTLGSRAFDFGVYDIATGEHKVLVQEYVYNVSVDDSGIYYWAVDEGEFRRMNFDGSNVTVILHGGDFFNYTDGNLYYIGLSEDANGSCRVVNQLNVETGETTTLLEELNEYFDANGNLIGVTFKQMQNGDYDPDMFEDTEYERVLKGGYPFFNESVNYAYVAGEYVFMRGMLRESFIQKGSFGCIARLDSGLMIWD